MSVTHEDVATILNLTRALIGQSAWSVELGIGSFLTFDFGKEIVSGRDFVRGEWHLWIMHCAWRLESTDEVFIACESPREKIATEIKTLENRTVTAFEITRPALDTIISFDGGFYLRLFPRDTDDYTRHWMLFMPDRSVLRIGLVGNWSVAIPDDE